MIFSYALFEKNYETMFYLKKAYYTLIIQQIKEVSIIRHYSIAGGV